MSTIEVLDKKIKELEESIEKSDSNEKTMIQSRIMIIDECEKTLSNDSLMIKYDFSPSIKLLNSFGVNFENLTQILSDIKTALAIREELNLSASDMPLAPEQINALNSFSEYLRIIKGKLGEKLKQISSKGELAERVDSLRSLKNIFEGKGVRKSYTEEMFKVFCEEFDVLNLPRQEALELLQPFLETKNFKDSYSEEKANFDDVVELYNEFLTPSKMKNFVALLNKYRNEIVSEIELDNTREILQFLKDKGIIDNFQKLTLLQISLYGDISYMREYVYPKIIERGSDFLEASFDNDYSSIWIVENRQESFRKGTFRKTRIIDEVNEDGSLYSTCHSVSIDDVIENTNLLIANSSLFDEKNDFSKEGSYLNVKSKPTWILKRNIELCKLFNLSSICPSCIINGDIEDKINLAIELGLLNPPLTPEFKEIDKEIVRNDEFQRRAKIKKEYNQSIRNYFQRYSTVLSNTTINEYSYLFYKLQTNGYVSFYNEFFSDNSAGKGNPDIIDEHVYKMIKDKKRMDEFVNSNFTIDWYPTLIEKFDEYDDKIFEYSADDKKQNNQNYIDESIFNDPLIKELEENNTVMNEYVRDGTIVKEKNKYVYMFGNRIISRYKVLRNASILKGIYNYLNEDMLMTSIVRNSFIDEKTFILIEESIKGRRGMRI